MSLRPSLWTAARQGWPPWRSSCMGPQVRSRHQDWHKQEDVDPGLDRQSPILENLEETPQRSS